MDKDNHPSIRQMLLAHLETGQENAQQILSYCQQHRISDQDRVALELIHIYNNQEPGEDPEMKFVREVFSDEEERSRLEREVGEKPDDLWRRTELRLHADSEYRTRIFGLYEAMAREIF